MASRLNILKAELEELDFIIGYWESRREDAYMEICNLVGKCPLCQDVHYPHCTANPSTNKV
jgi:hypothetical protein